jgi:membrane-bound lytic murein transglycosylase B
VPAVLAAILSIAAPVIASVPASYEEGSRDFAAEMASRHGFAPETLRSLLAQAQYRQEIIDAIRRPAEAKPWHAYRPIFLTPARIAGGAEFLRANRELLERARGEHGVPPEIVAAIIGVETNYGGNPGRHRVIDALTTLGFSYPARASFFRKELESLLLLGREEGLDLPALKGSYAGAMGLPQFIPSSYRAYAIDFDGDGRRDLFKSTADAIGSVASYLARHGWRPGEPIAVPARLQRPLPADLPVLSNRPEEPVLQPKRLIEAGITTVEPLPDTGRVNVVRLDAPGDEFWVGLTNFYVITRYNHSNLYAMAVYQLSREIRESYEAEE